MFNSCESKGKSVFSCDHDTNGNNSSNSNNGWVKLNVEVYLQDTIDQNGIDTVVSTQIFKGVCDVKYKKGQFFITNNEYQKGPEQIYIRIPTTKVQASCNLNSDLSKIRLKYYNSHTKSFDIVRVTSYDPDGWGINVILIGNLNYSET